MSSVNQKKKEDEMKMNYTSQVECLDDEMKMNYTSQVECLDDLLSSSGYS
jgi:hypothetical protein